MVMQVSAGACTESPSPMAERMDCSDQVSEIPFAAPQEAPEELVAMVSTDRWPGIGNELPCTCEPSDPWRVESTAAET